ncbi:hypothetical protein GQ457_02G041200 [Hibiscus cannabinus]
MLKQQGAWSSEKEEESSWLALNQIFQQLTVHRHQFSLNLTTALIEFIFDTFLFVMQDMDISSPAAFVNGGLLRIHVGRKVRTVLQVTRSDIGSVMGKSTDGCQLVAKGSPPVPLTSYVEVIGVAENENTIRAELWTNFGDTFDPSNYDKLCQLANGELKHLFL